MLSGIPINYAELSCRAAAGSRSVRSARAIKLVLHPSVLASFSHEYKDCHRSIDEIPSSYSDHFFSDQGSARFVGTATRCEANDRQGCTEPREA